MLRPMFTRRRFSAVSVGCQSCHGPASGHLVWAKDNKAVPGDARSRGFIADISAKSGRAQVDACAYCHALRSTLTAEYPVGTPLLDHTIPVGLDSTHYFNDGQQREEVFILGSWLQSRMPRRGWFVPIATIRTPARRRRPATRCARVATMRPAPLRVRRSIPPGSSVVPTTRRRITTTPSRSRASNAMPPSAPTWWSTHGWITHSAFRGRTSPSRRRRRTPATCATRTVTRSGRRPRSRNGTDLRGAQRSTTGRRSRPRATVARALRRRCK